ncbi:branched-chain amino acid ABC transporter permease [Compostimonas suwonensis]|uniref:Branched-chain amino acid transport system permease protein n=1 Tax=Compostimonas suwonensis TaxID=1048394 RepID=A0A2M9BCD1_9MICO|nr:branched-chain amino acid ABC transporter permease [Compostimonas suwonensis]PJJ55609.1 branched-chain amino acid transport system permease protein [Compostimonas suwonensis]
MTIKSPLTRAREINGGTASLSLARTRAQFWVEVALSVVIVSLPGLLQSAYYIRILEDIAVFGLLAMGLNLVFGYTGQISLGQAAFYALGSYGSVILETQLGVPVYLAWPLAIAFCMAVAWIISFPVLRLKGHYLALATLAFGLIVETLIGQGGTLTGGHDGLIVPVQSVLGEFLTSRFPYIVVGVAVLAYWLLRNLTNYSVGRALRSLRDDPDAAAALGVPVSRYRTASFVLAAGLSAIAGIFYAHVAQVVTPEVFSFDTSIQILLMVIIGGMGHRLGGVIGAVVVLLLPEFLYGLNTAKSLVFAIIVLIVLLFMPQGIAGLPRQISSWWRRTRRPVAKEPQA